ncbi:MAG: M23 family metallopeptidase [Cyanobacteria bacterium J06650_10]
MKRLFYLLSVFLIWLCIWCAPVSAQDLSPDVSDSLEAQILELSFDDLPAFEGDGFMLGYRDTIFQAEGQAGVDHYDEAIAGYESPYDPAREWIAGQFPSEVIKLGDLMYTGIGIEQLTMDGIGQITGIDIENFQLADVPFLRDLTLSDLVGDVPFLGDYALVDLPNLVERIGGSGSQEMLSQYLASNPDIADMSIAESGLGSLQVSDVPNLGATKLGEIPEVGDDVIANVPGLSIMQFGSYPGLEMVGGLIPIAKQDISFGEKEYSGQKVTPKPVSGGTNGKETWEPIACVGGCAHIELYDSDISPIKGAWAGSNWMTNKHRVRDGFGILGAVFNEAGAYRVPFGPTFALQVRGTDEATGSADWGIAFRVCKRGFIDLGCTAYFMEVPLPITTHEGATILTGIKDGLGGSTQPIKAPDGWEDLRPETPPEVRALIGAHTPRGSRGSFGLCGEGPGGVNFQSLAAAFSSIEGNYNSVGAYTARGRGLGRYQYMTYREDVKASIKQKSGGEAFLRRVEAGSAVSPSEVEEYFPAADQDAIFRADRNRNIEQAMSEGFTGSEIIERVGQIHFGGPDAPIDGSWSDTHGRLTLKTYGEELAETYQAVESSDSSSDSECTPGGLIAGKSIQDAIAYEQADFQDFDAYRAYRGGYHAGIDFDYRFGAGEGGEVVSLLGGEVVDTYAIAQNRVTGEGSVTVVVATTDSDGRDVQLLYTHLSESSVASAVEIGSTVSPGQSLGVVGGEDTVSRGAHLDLKIKVDGNYVDPDEFMQAVVDGGGTVTTIDVATGAKGTAQVGGFQ